MITAEKLTYWNNLTEDEKSFVQEIYRNINPIHLTIDRVDGLSRIHYLRPDGKQCVEYRQLQMRR